MSAAGIAGIAVAIVVIAIAITMDCIQTFNFSIIKLLSIH
jgi:hypothetical protein